MKLLGFLNLRVGWESLNSVRSSPWQLMQAEEGTPEEVKMFFFFFVGMAGDAVHLDLVVAVGGLAGEEEGFVFGLEEDVAQPRRKSHCDDEPE